MRLALRQFGRREAGDTIVEVVIAMAILSSVLIGAYALTRNSVASTQDAQERSQAVKLVESQIEYLHTTTPPAQAAGAFCFSGSGGGVVYTLASTGATYTHDCVVDASSAPAGSAEPAYTLDITQQANTVFQVRAKWDAIRGGTNNVTYYYRPE